MKNRQKLIVAIVLFAFAIGLGAYQMFGTPSGIPVDQSLAEPWYCYGCGEGLMLAPIEYEATIGKAIHPAYEGEAGDTTALVTVVRCPKCGGPAVAARICEEHLVVFDPRHRDPAKRSCPQCPAEAPD